MSKAFTRESDEVESIVLPARTALPPGTKNYITSAGAQRLQDELNSLLGARALRKEDNGQREARIRQLQIIMESLVIAERPKNGEDVVRFGATVTVQRANEKETYRLVGVDEINLDRNEISWLAPLAKVLLGKRVGDRVRFRTPEGAADLTVLSVSYD